MIYLYFVKKAQGEKGIASLLKLINLYADGKGKNDFFLCWPGFIGNGPKKIAQFVIKFPDSKRNLARRGYFFPALNGKIKCKGTTCDKYLNLFYGNYSFANGPTKDHSKMVFFLENNFPNKALTINDFSSGIKVKALCIGSSNQSYNTYIRSPAVKGEADVFLIDGNALGEAPVQEDEAIKILKNAYADSNGQEDEPKIILAKQIEGNINLTEILRSCLN